MITKSLQEAVREALKSVGPLAKGQTTDPLIVAVSGGPDSLALLHALVAGGIHPPQHITVAHLDHLLRTSSSGDARFVSELATALGTSAVVDRVDVGAEAEEQGMTIEEAGRSVRYAFFARVARRAGAQVVLTGHTANDQAETILMNLLRGAGPAGLRGMQPVTYLPGKEEILLVRPLLKVNREEIEEYCAAYQLNPVRDATNQDTTYYRNWIRLQLLPLIAERNPGMVDRLRQTADIISADYELLANLLDDTWALIKKGQGDGWLNLDLDLWRVLPLSLKRSTLKRAAALLRNSDADIGFQTIENARQVAEGGQVGSVSTLPGQLILRVGYRELLLSVPGAEIPAPDYPQMLEPTPIILLIPGEIALSNSWRVKARLVENVDISKISMSEDPTREIVDLTGVRELIIRPREVNERFQPLGMGGHSALVQDVMVNRRIPLAARTLWPIVATSEHLVWLVGHQIDHRSRLRSSTRSAVILSLESVSSSTNLLPF